MATTVIGGIGIGIAVVALVGGGIYYYLRNRKNNENENFIEGTQSPVRLTEHQINPNNQGPEIPQWKRV